MDNRINKIQKLLPKERISYCPAYLPYAVQLREPHLDHLSSVYAPVNTLAVNFKEVQFGIHLILT